MLSGFVCFLSRIDLIDTSLFYVVLRLVWSVRTAFESLDSGYGFCKSTSVDFDAFRFKEQPTRYVEKSAPQLQ